MYGASEVGTIAWQCKRSDLYHINADVVIWSLLDESGSESKTGSGKIVLTNLYYKASPVIRYCIDDHVTIADRPCKCGHSEPCIGKIIGRDNDYILIKDKRRIPPDVVESLISNNIRDVKQYQLLQHDYAKFTLSVVPDTHCDVDAVRTVVWQMSRALGDSDIKIELVDRIPKISGRHKLATIISLLDDGSV
jgi:phenylacetate-coenzyme A ligase PaaK-like adenylate-forming protein